MIKLQRTLSDKFHLLFGVLFYYDLFVVKSYQRMNLLIKFIINNEKEGATWAMIPLVN
jgi:hypothetical protein